MSPPFEQQGIVALLQEISQLLRQLALSDENGVIDLRRSPLSPAQREALLTLLGQGEVSAELTVMGRSRVEETALAGVWWVTHYNEEGVVVAELLEIAPIPQILLSVEDELGESQDRLQQMIDGIINGGSVK
ncbi:MAG: hydrogenase expression/formation protein [Gammaproteobacteria bacterium]|nr:hydrogenase expression/formation protein [Gammaproteobacteria bacterium]